jgi:hypothetical protein
MNKKEFFEWLETCPTHKWEVNDELEFTDVLEYIVVSFPTEEEDEEEEVGEDFCQACEDGTCSELTEEEA